MTFALVMGVLATGVIFFSQSYEIRSIFIPDPTTGTYTRPSRSTFWIWAVVQAVMTASYIGTGAVWSAGVGVAYTVTILVIAVLSLRYGYAHWSRLDTWCAVGAAVTIALWVSTGEPMVGLLAGIATDAIGAIPTIRKVWAEPTSESRIAWAWTVVGNALNFFAISSLSLANLSYTTYLFVINGVIAYGIWFSPRARRGMRSILEK